MNNEKGKLPKLPTVLPGPSPEKRNKMMEVAIRTAEKVSRGEPVNGT